MDQTNPLDSLYREAVLLMDRGDQAALDQFLGLHPSLVQNPLKNPGLWLKDLVGGSLDGYFQSPWLIWFVAENPIRLGKLPANIVSVARTIIEHSQHHQVPELCRQLSYTLDLICTGRVPRECGVQGGLINLLLDSGATIDEGYGALGSGNLEAAAHLIERGQKLNLATALCLDRWNEADRLEPKATAEEHQIALIAAALNGKPRAISWLIEKGTPLNGFGPVIHPHATPLHHAVCSGSMDSVKILVHAGADRTLKDKVYGGTPLDWAEHEGHPEIAAFLKGLG